MTARHRGALNRARDRDTAPLSAPTCTGRHRQGRDCLSTTVRRCATLRRMTIEIRNATRDEYTAVADAMSTAFLERPDVAAIGAQVQDLWEPDRTWVAVDRGRICGTFRSWPTE